MNPKKRQTRAIKSIPLSARCICATILGASLVCSTVSAQKGNGGDHGNGNGGDHGNGNCGEHGNGDGGDQGKKAVWKPNPPPAPKTPPPLYALRPSIPLPL